MVHVCTEWYYSDQLALNTESDKGWQVHTSTQLHNVIRDDIRDR